MKTASLETGRKLEMSDALLAVLEGKLTRKDEEGDQYRASDGRIILLYPHIPLYSISYII